MADEEENGQVLYAVAYARVSTDDKDQDPEYQLNHIRNWAKGKNVKIVREFKDESTGTNTERDGYMLMRGYINEHRKISLLLVMDNDRLSRKMSDASRILKELNELGVRVVYTTNDGLDTSTAEGELINQVLSYGAQNYTDHLGAKIRAGMKKAKENGKQIGRPMSRINLFDINLLLGYASMGYSIRDVAKVHRCSRLTISNRLKDENKLEEYKELYQKAISEGKIGPGVARKTSKE